VPLSASVGPGVDAQVVFDQNLVTGPLDEGGWSWRSMGVRYEGDEVSVLSGSVVSLSGIPTGADPGVDNIDYSPPPFDVVSLATGLPAVGFTGFPAT